MSPARAVHVDTQLAAGGPAVITMRHDTIKFPRAQLSDRAQAARAVCSTFPVPHVAVCIPASATQLSIDSVKTNLIDSIGVNGTLHALDNISAASSRSRCHEAAMADEAQLRQRLVAVILITDGSLVVTQPLWPYCFHRWERSRMYSSMLWVTRADAAALLADDRSAPPPQVDHLLAVALHLPMPSQQGCAAWRNATPNHAVIDWLACLPARPRVAASDHLESSRGSYRHRPSPWSGDSSRAGTAPPEAICRTLSRRPTPRPRLALGIAGLARTFATPLVHMTLKGHVIDAVGALTTVFASLRLGDDRRVVMQGLAQRDAMAIGDGEIRPRVLAALDRLGAARENVELHEGVTFTRGASDHDDALVPPNCSYITHPATPPLPPSSCNSYMNLCALPTALGQLASRRAIFRMVVTHEARTGMRFDSVLFLRPDLAVLVPLLPYCFHPLDSSRFYADRIVWLARHELDGAFGPPAVDAFRSCVVRFERGPERFFEQLAAVNNVTMSPAPPLMVMPIIRPHIKTMPPSGHICRLATEGLAAYARTHGGLTPQSAFFHTELLHYTSLRQSTCPRLTFLNPSNAF